MQATSNRTAHTFSGKVFRAISHGVVRFGPSVAVEILEQPMCSMCQIQSTLGFTTMDFAGNLGIATATPLTDLRHYIIATLGITASNFVPYVAK